MAWEFCTKVLEMPEDKLYVTIYQDDDEAFEIWTKQNGVDPSHIVRLGKEDNFWQYGPGPAAPARRFILTVAKRWLRLSCIAAPAASATGMLSFGTMCLASSITMEQRQLHGAEAEEY